MAVAKGCILVLSLSACFALAGCTLFESTRTTSFMKPFRTESPESEQNVVQIDVAILERPLGDPYINSELWKHTDEMVVDLEHRPTIEDNGFRVGQVIGMTPDGLQNLLKSERYCINPRRRVVPVGKTITQYLSADATHTEFDLYEAGGKKRVAFDQARLCLDFVSSISPDGKTRLTFTPKVEYGENLRPFVPDPDHSTWTLSNDKPFESYPEQTWQVAMLPNEFLVIGTRLDKRNTLGYRALVQDAEGADPCQRLLVLRVTRSAGAPSRNAGDSVTEEKPGAFKSPPLAAQATATYARGVAQDGR